MVEAPPGTQTAPPQVAASSTLALVDYLRKTAQPDLAHIESLLAIPLATLAHPDQRLPAEQHYRLWQYAEQLTGDPLVGLHAGTVVDPDRMGLVGHVFFNCDTLGDAITQYVRLQRLVNESVQLNLEQRDGLAILSWQPDAPNHYCSQDMDRTLAAAVCRVRHFIRPDFQLAWVALAHDHQGQSDAYQRLFTCPLRFNQASTGLAFAEQYLQHPIPHRNPYVHSAMLKHVNSILAKLQTRRSFSRKVRRLIAQQMASDRIDADSLARQCHMSRQTLYRKLKKEGYCFHDLVEHVRQDKALRYVAEDRYSLGEIAFLLGFSELSAFSRAFKRWTGMSPAHYREQARLTTPSGPEGAP
ncbi:MAG: AraC family transcriptional regulator [Marinobacter sp.]|nr:AraC family transcriptional regulator [Marinobacter sp.]